MLNEVGHSTLPSSVSLYSVVFLAASFIMDSSLGSCHQKSINGLTVVSHGHKIHGEERQK